MMDKVMTALLGMVYDPMTLSLCNFNYVPPYFLQAAMMDIVIL